MVAPISIDAGVKLGDVWAKRRKTRNIRFVFVVTSIRDIIFRQKRSTRNETNGTNAPSRPTIKGAKRKGIIISVKLAFYWANLRLARAVRNTLVPPFVSFFSARGSNPKPYLRSGWRETVSP